MLLQVAFTLIMEWKLKKIFFKQYFIRSGSRLVAYTSPFLYIYKLQMKNSIQNTIHRIT